MRNCLEILSKFSETMSAIGLTSSTCNLCYWEQWCSSVSSCFIMDASDNLYKCFTCSTSSTLLQWQVVSLGNFNDLGHNNKTLNRFFLWSYILNCYGKIQLLNDSIPGPYMIPDRTRQQISQSMGSFRIGRILICQ